MSILGRGDRLSHSGKLIPFIPLVPVVMLAIACLSLATHPGANHVSALETATPPGDAGLSWHECETNGAEVWQQVEACLEHPLPTWGENERNWAAQGPAGKRELRIGQHVYRTQAVEIPYPPITISILSKDGRPIKAFVGLQSPHSPDISLDDLGGHAAWEYADDQQATIIYDGQDLRQVYSLDAAYRPYLMAGKLIFVGQKDGRYFVVDDGKRVGPQFDRIIVAYCCEAVLYSVRSGEGRYVFWGIRDGREYLVELTAA